jgi:hypothetical protein
MRKDVEVKDYYLPLNNNVRKITKPPFMQPLLSSYTGYETSSEIAIVIDGL